MGKIFSRTQVPSFSVIMLIIATALWGLSFPFMKALGIEEQILLPGANTMFTSAASMSFRFGIAALCTLLICMKTISKLSIREIISGVALGIFIGAGGILQIDGISFTSASTSAFLTAFYAILVPVFIAIYKRKIPHIRVWLSSILVIIGIAILSGMTLTNFSPGRGELETLAASVFFTFQILWMERVDPSKDNAIHVTLIMCTVIAILQFTAAFFMAPHFSDIFTIHASVRSWSILIILGLPATVIPFILMNRFQPLVKPTAAGIIYCIEPVFAVIFAAFLPSLIVRQPALYPNEIITMQLFIGGMLVILANVLIQKRVSR